MAIKEVFMVARLVRCRLSREARASIRSSSEVTHELGKMNTSVPAYFLGENCGRVTTICRGMLSHLVLSPDGLPRTERTQGFKGSCILLMCQLNGRLVKRLGTPDVSTGG